MGETSMYIQGIVVILLSVIGWFLRGIYANIQKMAESIQRLNEKLLIHEERSATINKRLDRNDERLDKLIDEFREFELNTLKR